jgi:hypothetical protein
MDETVKYLVEQVKRVGEIQGRDKAIDFIVALLGVSQGFLLSELKKDGLSEKATTEFLLGITGMNVTSFYQAIPEKECNMVNLENFSTFMGKNVYLEVYDNLSCEGLLLDTFIDSKGEECVKISTKHFKTVNIYEKRHIRSIEVKLNEKRVS